MKFSINGTCLEVRNEIDEYNEIIFGRFSQFELSYDKPYNFLYFKKDKVEICLKDKCIVLNNKVIKTDIYTIICNVIAYLIDDEKNMLMHSVVVSKDNIGKLIIGNFGQGKTTLAKTFEEKGYEINSTDQTWLQIKDNKLYQILGSRFGLNKENTELLDFYNSNKKIKIEQIIRIVGLCDEGIVTFNGNNNKYHIIKNLAQFCNWNYNLPIFTDNLYLYDTNKYVKIFLENLSELEIPVLDVRGDKNKILEELGVR
ncbi:MAG: hypothetical protein IJJ82_00320 [Clostridia bacterium]|nr:hypothetical protein [Clostridia bacterium]